MANFDTLIDKAGRAAQSAALLLDNKDIDGACNRAYYAMFDAARAAWVISQAAIFVAAMRKFADKQR